MIVFSTNWILLLGVVLIATPCSLVYGSPKPTLVMDQDILPRTCRYSRAYGMIQVRCANLGLLSVPPNLKTEIQILDASINRVRELTKDSLSSYTSLEYLYLGDNFIQEIDDHAFDNLRYLKVLDLSTNGCDNLPKNLFQLPQLQKLYLCRNKINDLTFEDLDVKSPLTYVQLAENRLSKIPWLGPVPTLSHLNVSGNAISRISTEDLAPFCSLKVLDLSKNPIKFDADNCECHVFRAWLEIRGIRSRPLFNCSQEEELNCPKSITFNNETMEMYQNCANIIQFQAETEKARTTWILVACCIFAFLLCLFLGLFCVHRRNKRRKKKLKEEQRLNANNANTELLNSNLSQPENT